MSKAQRPVGFADVNICLVSALRSQKKTQEFEGKEITKAGEFLLEDVVCPSLSMFLGP